MEILGIVWAASIIHPSHPIPAKTVGSETQPPPALAEKMADWLNSLINSYGWVYDTLEAPATYKEFAFTASWLTPHLAPLVSDAEPPSAATESFKALVPSIGTSLISFEGAPSKASAPLDSDVLPLSQWHGWNAVAAVRLEQAYSADSRKPDMAGGLENHCLPHAPVAYQASAIAMKASPKVQVWVHNQFIGEVAGQTGAQKIAEKLRGLIRQGKLQPDELKPIFTANYVGIGHQDELLFLVDETLQSHPEVPATAIALQWVNNLRQAFKDAPLEVAEVQIAAAGLVETPQVLYGTASWYGPGFHGQKTANGERFNQYTLTAAHKTLPFNTYLKVTNRSNGKSVVVRINDRGPYVGKRSLDLSKAAAQCLGSTHRGIIPYEAVILKAIPKPELDELTTVSLKLD